MLKHITEHDAAIQRVLYFWNMTALDLDHGAYLYRTSGNTRGGLPKYVLIVKGRRENLVDLFTGGGDWLYRSFVRAWSIQDALEIANQRLIKYLSKKGH